MSLKSPAEHIMTSPVPLSICARGCAWIGTSLLKTGVIAFFPARCL